MRPAVVLGVLVLLAAGAWLLRSGAGARGGPAGVRVDLREPTPRTERVVLASPVDAFPVDAVPEAASTVGDEPASHEREGAGLSLVHPPTYRRDLPPLVGWVRKPRELESFGALEVVGSPLGLGLDAPELRAAVQPDGTFTMPLPDGLVKVDLRLDSDVLYVDGPVEVRPYGPRVVLEPELRAVIVGRLVNRPDVDEWPPRFGVRVSWTTANSTSPRTPDRHRRAGASNRRFVLPHVLPHVALGLRIDDGAEEPLRLHVASLEPGERREIVVDLAAAFDVSGRVVDSLGEPVGAARVLASTARGEPDLPFLDAWSKTDRQGAFRLERLPAGRLALTAYDDAGRRTARTTIEDLRTDVEDLVLVLNDPDEERER